MRTVIRRGGEMEDPSIPGCEDTSGSRYRVAQLLRTNRPSVRRFDEIDKKVQPKLREMLQHTD